MEKVYKVGFIGDNIVKEPLIIGSKIRSIIYRLLKERERVEFIIPIGGEFGAIAAYEVSKLKKGVYRDKFTVTGVDTNTAGRSYLKNGQFYDRILKADFDKSYWERLMRGIEYIYAESDCLLFCLTSWTPDDIRGYVLMSCVFKKRKFMLKTGNYSEYKGVCFFNKGFAVKKTSDMRGRRK